MTRLEVPFNLGFKLGSLSRQVEIVIETASKSSSNKRIKIKVYRVYDSLKYILDELMELGISEMVQKDLKSYLNQLAGGRIDEELEQEQEEGEEQEDDETRVFGKIRKKFKDRRQNLSRDLKENKARELDVKLKLWKDRIAVDFNKKSSEK
ncbi:MAG: hypothetical protein ACXAEU_03140 [Candidatus Hodarchaeales archaeon]|jgi:hypothetical protein